MRVIDDRPDVLERWGLTLNEIVTVTAIEFCQIAWNGGNRFRNPEYFERVEENR